MGYAFAFFCKCRQFDVSLWRLWAAKSISAVGREGVSNPGCCKKTKRENIEMLLSYFAYDSKASVRYTLAASGTWDVQHKFSQSHYLFLMRLAH
jgi:hypothetical protein